jgi:hypothetical protein
MPPVIERGKLLGRFRFIIRILHLDNFLVDFEGKYMSTRYFSNPRIWSFIPKIVHRYYFNWQSWNKFILFWHLANVSVDFADIDRALSGIGASWSQFNESVLAVNYAHYLTRRNLCLQLWPFSGIKIPFYKFIVHNTQISVVLGQKCVQNYEGKNWPKSF